MNFFGRLSDTRITKKDVVILLTRVLIAILLCYATGVIYGLILYVILENVVDQVVKKLYKVYSISYADKNVWWD